MLFGGEKKGEFFNRNAAWVVAEFSKNTKGKCIYGGSPAGWILAVAISPAKILRLLACFQKSEYTFFALAAIIFLYPKQSK